MINVAIVGGGYISDWHLKSLKKIQGVRVVAICDLNKSRADILAKSVDAQGFQDFAQMLETGKVDVVQILTPPHLHYSQAKMALEAGCHVYLEKPMCTTAEQCNELVEIARQKKLQLGVGHNFLFYSVFEQLKNDFQGGKIGVIQEIFINWHQELPQYRFGPFDTWMLQKPGNILLEIGAHLFSQIEDLLGGQYQVVSVFPDRKTMLPGNKPFYRRWLINLLCNDVRIVVSMDFQAGFPEYQTKVRGSLGTACVDFLKNTYHLGRDTTYSMDINRYLLTKSESKSLRKEARYNLRNYFLGKLKLTDKDNFYGYSITCSLQSFYESLQKDEALDNRISGNTGAKLISLGCELASKCEFKEDEQYHENKIEKEGIPEILLTGGTGFIGKELLFMLLDKGYKVRLFTRSIAAIPFSTDHKGLTVFEGSIFNEVDLDKAMQGIKVVYHLAVARANSWKDWLATDVHATELLAKKCIEHSIERFIYTGTIDSYWSGDQSIEISEATGLDTKIKQRNFYARAKAQSEEILMDYYRTKNLPVIIVRPGVVIGKEGNPVHWGIGMWNGLGVVQVWGKGETPLPLVLVQDVAQGLFKCLDNENIIGESFNFIGPPLLTAREYLATIEETMHIKLQIHFVSSIRFFVVDVFKWLVKVAVRHPSRDRVPSYRDFASRSHKAFYDCRKAKEMLGWAPETDKQALIDKGIIEPCHKLLD